MGFKEPLAAISLIIFSIVVYIIIMFEYNDILAIYQEAIDFFLLFAFIILQ